MRPAVPADAEALAELYARCSLRSRFRRFGGFLRELPGSFVEACLAGEPWRHDALVVVAGDASERMPVVGLGTAALVETTRGEAVDLSLLVEDVWQRHGVGRQLFWELLDRARERGVEWVTAQVSTEQTEIATWIGRELDVVDADYEREAVTLLARRRRAGA